VTPDKFLRTTAQEDDPNQPKQFLARIRLHNTNRTALCFSLVPKDSFVPTSSGSTYVPKRRSHTVNSGARFLV
jgi:hypothetical protein